MNQKIDTELIDDMFADTLEVPDDNSLQEVSDLVTKMLNLEARIASLNLDLVAATNDLRDIAEKTIPEKMLNMGLMEITLSNGYKLEIKKMYNASIKPENQDAAFTWLKEHELDDLIKNEVKLTFGRGEDEAANILIEALVEQGYAVDNKRGVHPQTLKAFVREQIESGNADFPRETFGVFILDRAKVKAPKKKGGF